MKNQMTNFWIAIILTSITLTSCAQDKIIPESELPEEIATYLKTHFPNNPVLQVSIDNELFSKSHEVILQDNITLEFNAKNEVTEIEANSKLPDSVIPVQIIEYVKNNYPENVIIEWQIDDKNQQVGLENDIQLEFNMKGDFLKIDD